MENDDVTRNLESMDDLDFTAWNGADWHGLFAHYHTDDVLVVVHGQPRTNGIQEHIDAMKALVAASGGTPPQITSHPISFGSGEWTCVVGEFADARRMVTVAKWRDGAIAEEHIWM
jgi:ketosteroid isomerase-like protein